MAEPGPLIVGMFLDEPPPGSIESTCDNCGGTIILGPESQRVIATVADTAKVCPSCLFRHLPQMAPTEVKRAKDYRPHA